MEKKRYTVSVQLSAITYEKMLKHCGDLDGVGIYKMSRDEKKPLITPSIRDIGIALLRHLSGDEHALNNYAAKNASDTLKSCHKHKGDTKLKLLDCTGCPNNSDFFCLPSEE